MELADLDGFCGSPFWVSGAHALLANNTHSPHARRSIPRYRDGPNSGFLFLGLEHVVEHNRSRCHALFREDRPGLVALPVPVAVLSAGGLLPGAQQVQGHTVELAKPVQTGESYDTYFVVVD